MENVSRPELSRRPLGCTPTTKPEQAHIKLQFLPAPLATVAFLAGAAAGTAATIGILAGRSGSEAAS